MKPIRIPRSGRPLGASLCLAACWLLAAPRAAHASMFQGETLDAIANAISWVVLVIVPVVLITAFWMVHILPEKIAHKRGHPQTKAIQCLCLLSLVFGGLLWPIAWLWAYTKPVLHRMAYGTDVDHSLHHEDEGDEGKSGAAERNTEPVKGKS